MSVFLAVWLDCNGPGCKTRFSPSPPTTSTPRARALASAADWRTNYRNKGKDYCPRCANGHLPDTSGARGICQGCGCEQHVTKQALVRLHRRRNGRGVTEPCPGGGHAPQRLVRMAMPRGERWKSLI